MNRLITFLIASFLSSVSFATVFPYTPLPNTEPVQGSYCDPNSNLKTAVSIDSMTNLIDGTKPVDADNDPPVYATGCYAVSDPNNDFQSTYDPNTGKLYEGMYNGDPENPDNTGYYVDPNIFLTHENDQWVDDDTPGWISLASIGVEEVGEGENKELDFSIDYSYIGIYDLDDLLDITFGIDDDGGFWSLNFNPANENIVELITAILGRPTVFDHLSFMFKGPSHQDWYMYDFNFRELIAGGLGVDLNDPHHITGSWDSSLFFGKFDVSHIEIVAHDPPPDEIPEPQSLMIFALGLILLGVRYKIKV